MVTQVDGEKEKKWAALLVEVKEENLFKIYSRLSLLGQCSISLFSISASICSSLVSFLEDSLILGEVSKRRVGGLRRRKSF